mmetsp:Transcript_3703/g.6655  ORF Transcript_3703/g.6655 Transcript_3703/m.6655 type:complete len:241 (-) Transcript_3703:126-848(-)
MEEGPHAWKQIPRPTRTELPRVHEELGIWMSHTRYQLHDVDRIPLWRVQNTSIAVGTGVGIGSYLALKRFRPSIKFPIDILPPFVAFYAMYRFASVAQWSGLWDTFLSLPSPLGETARGLVAAVRSGGRLPSDDFGRAPLRPAQQSQTAKPTQQMQQMQQAEADAPRFHAQAGQPAEAPSLERKEMFGRPPAPSEAPETLGWGGGGWEETASTSSPEQSASKRTSWDEIRRKAAEDSRPP